MNHVHELQGEAYWFRMNHNVQKDISIQRLAACVASCKSELLALPGVAEAHEGAVNWHKKRVAELKALPEMQAFYEQITSPRMEKLSRLGPLFSMQVFIDGPQAISDKVLDRVPADVVAAKLAPPKATK